MGGVDLSIISQADWTASGVPARVGGVDLSNSFSIEEMTVFVPARVGGVDLSPPASSCTAVERSSRPCGRGGFKLYCPSGNV